MLKQCIFLQQVKTGSLIIRWEHPHCLSFINNKVLEAIIDLVYKEVFSATYIREPVFPV